MMPFATRPSADGDNITPITQNNETITSVDEGLLGVTISYNKPQ
jgi:hypothetical protein